MRVDMLLAAGAALILTASPAPAAEPQPAVAPVPGWVVSSELPPPNPARASAPFQILLRSTQERIRPDGVENYVQFASMPQTTAGLQSLGNVVIPWNAERSELTIHRVAIRRGSSTVDLLKPSEILVLRRENNLERAVLDGIRTVVIPTQGLQTGDILDVALTFNSRKSSIGKKAEDLFPLDSSMPVARIEHRFLVPENVSVRWKIGSETLKPQVVKRDGLTEHIFRQANVEPLTIPKNTPARFKMPILQFSAYQSWSEVADELDGLFDEARRPSANSALRDEAAKIASTTSDPGKRMLAALRLAQDRVRYVALLLGEGAYVPSSADQTWDRKFGDCKGKTVLLLALLDQLGIKAEPVLVSTSLEDHLANQLPGLTVFDHVIVRASIGGRSYFLDPTDYGQRTLEEVAAPAFRQGLPLRAGATLETFAIPPLTAPVREAQLVWDASKGIDGPTPYQATLTLRGDAAAEMRSKLGAATDDKKFETALKDLMPGVDNDDLVISEKNPEAVDGSFVVRFAGKAEMDWSPFEGEKNTRFSFNHSTMHWQAEFDRKEGPGKDWPVSLGSGRYWERTIETVVLPNGGNGYSIDGQPMSKTLAGSSIYRALHKQGDRMTMVSEFRHHQREISAAEARAAEPMLEEINEDYAYIVGPPERKTRKR